MSGVARPVWPGELSDADRAGLVGLVAAARRDRDWSGVAERLVRLRARGVPVAALSAVVGVGETRLRRVCRVYGPDPASVRDPLADAGWVDTCTAARTVLGVGVARLLEYTAQAGDDGIAVMAGCSRLWQAAPRGRTREPGSGPQLSVSRARKPVGVWTGMWSARPVRSVSPETRTAAEVWARAMR